MTLIAQSRQKSTTFNATLGSPGTATLGVIGSGSVMVVDQIQATFTTGAAADNVNVFLLANDGGGGFNVVMLAKSSYAAATADTIEIQFPNGMPLWQVSASGVVPPTPVADAAPTIQLTCDSSGDASGLTGPTLLVLWHLEPLTARSPKQ